LPILRFTYLHEHWFSCRSVSRDAEWQARIRSLWVARRRATWSNMKTTVHVNTFNSIFTHGCPGWGKPGIF
jgi:adenosyl cobinamide kinase/adenosyl cobinamide phosphate guanylyltransferase